MNEIVIDAFAKVNIGLDVLGRREDGYHIVKMIMQTIGLKDVVTVTKRPEISDIIIKSDSSRVPTGNTNLAWKAARKILDRFGIEGGVEIFIEKHIPMEAGLAGGSTDGAAVITAMNSLYDLNMSPELQDEIALSLGADVPFCLRRGTYLSEGIGEVLTEISDMPKAYVLIVKPEFGISTKWSYETLDSHPEFPHPDIDGLVRAIEEGNVGNISRRMGNILEDVALTKYPVIGEIKKTMMAEGAAGSMMSGSGPTVFGIYVDRTAAEKAREVLREENRNYQIHLTEFLV